MTSNNFEMSVLGRVNQFGAWVGKQIGKSLDRRYSCSKYGSLDLKLTFQRCLTLYRPIINRLPRITICLLKCSLIFLSIDSHNDFDCLWSMPSDSNAAIMFDQRCRPNFRKCLRPRLSFENIRNCVHFLAVLLAFFVIGFAQTCGIFAYLGPIGPSLDLQ